MLAVRAAWVISSEKNQLRGSPPGKGDHVVDANYNSGLGGQTGQFRVPKDPEEYARRFVPRSKAVTATILGLLVLTGVLTLFWRIRRRGFGTGDHSPPAEGVVENPKRASKRLFGSQTRHLPTARPGANVRLQFGKSGCLTMIRRKPRAGDGGYLARWEFWQPDEGFGPPPSRGRGRGR